MVVKTRWRFKRRSSTGRYLVWEQIEPDDTGQITYLCSAEWFYARMLVT